MIEEESGKPVRSLVVQDRDLVGFGHCVEFQGCSFLPSSVHNILRLDTDLCHGETI